MIVMMHKIFLNVELSEALHYIQKTTHGIYWYVRARHDEHSNTLEMPRINEYVLTHILV